MKKITTICIALLVLFSFSAISQSQEDMKAMMDYMTPGEFHKMFAKWDGKWTEDLTFWMTPGAPPTKANATCVNKMILGGRYQESKHNGDMMGMPFEGLGTLGWDNARKILVSTWIDNFGTGIMYMEGSWDNATKSATLKGKTTDPATGKEIPVREIFKIVDDNTQTMEMYMTVDGKEFKSMEVTFKRAK
jgi:hypothetical protein